MENEIGIYCIQSKIYPNKIYIGSSRNLKKRISGHLHEIKTKKHYNVKIRNHVKKYGSDDLEIFIIKNCQIDELLIEEQFYIDILNPYFNISKITTFPLYEYHESIKKDPTLKRVISDETRLKISNAHKGIKKSEDSCLLMKKAWETRRQIPVSIETRERQSSSQKGRKHSDETKDKISKSQKGVPWSEKQKESFLNSTTTKGASRFFGVGFSKSCNKFYAAIHYDGKKKHICLCNNEIDAAIAYNEYVIKNNIPNKRLNVIPEEYAKR